MDKTRMEIVKYIDEVVGVEGVRPMVMSHSWKDNDVDENNLNDLLVETYGFKSPIFSKYPKSVFVIGEHDMLKFHKPFTGSEMVSTWDKTFIIIFRTKLREKYPDKLRLDEIDEENQIMHHRTIDTFEVYIYKST